jgi:hypothetical protein
MSVFMMVSYIDLLVSIGVFIQRLNLGLPDTLTYQASVCFGIRTIACRITLSYVKEMLAYYFPQQEKE